MDLPFIWREKKSKSFTYSRAKELREWRAGERKWEKRSFTFGHPSIGLSPFDSSFSLASLLFRSNHMSTVTWPSKAIAKSQSGTWQPPILCSFNVLLSTVVVTVTSHCDCDSLLSLSLSLSSQTWISFHFALCLSWWPSFFVGPSFIFNFHLLYSLTHTLWQKALYFVHS